MPYECAGSGNGLYKALIRVDFQVNHLDLVQKVIEFIYPSKFVVCEPQTGPPPPPIVCAQLGSYASKSAGCGIGTFTLSNIEPDILTVMGFGKNGTVEFNQDPTDPKVFNSESQDLTIFDEAGHTCSLTCGPEASQLTLKCSKPQKMCTEVFTLK